MQNHRDDHTLLHPSMHILCLDEIKSTPAFVDLPGLIYITSYMHAVCVPCNCKPDICELSDTPSSLHDGYILAPVETRFPLNKLNWELFVLFRFLQNSGIDGSRG